MTDSLNKIIKEYFEKNDLSLSDVKRETGIAHSTLSSIINNPDGNPSMKTWDTLKGRYKDIIPNNDLSLKQRQLNNIKRLNQIANDQGIVEWRGVPIYNTEVTAGMLSLVRDEPLHEPAYFLPIPGFRDCTFGARVAGDSMVPEIRNGDWVVCKEVRDFIFGDIYLIVTEDGQETVKYIYPHNDIEFVNLVPANKDLPITPMAKKNIIKIYKVKGVIKGY